jgi:hypothetical protein
MDIVEFFVALAMGAHFQFRFPTGSQLKEGITSKAEKVK